MISSHKAIFLTVLASACWATTRGPDTGGYTGTDSAVYSFVDVSSSGASVLAGVDDGTAPLTIPYSFQFYGQAYTMVCVSSNGAMYFILSASSCSGINDFANTDLTTTATPGGLPGVFPFWSDLTFQVAGGGAVFYQTLGTAGSRKFVVQWANAYPAGSSNPVTFQVILFEGTNQVLFQYRTVNLGAGNPASNGGLATIGISNAGGLGSGQQIEWSYQAPVLGNSVALSFSPAVTTTCPANITSKVTITRGGFAFNGGTQRFLQTVTLTNSSGSGISSPIYLALDGLSSNASLANATGVTTCSSPSGSPYITVIPSGTLAAGQAAAIQLQFANPSKAGITYTPRILSGAGTP
jgi:hypothetical protein